MGVYGLGVRESFQFSLCVEDQHVGQLSSSIFSWVQKEERLSLSFFADCLGLKMKPADLQGYRGSLRYRLQISNENTR